MLDLPGKQEELIEAIKAHRQAVRGRALQRPPAGARRGRRPTRRRSSRRGSAVSRPATAWRMSLYGEVNPGGKLPVSFPRNEGQVPIYYNHQPTGRPCDPSSKYNSRHRDITTCTPQYEFGYGLSYTTFQISNLRLSSTTMDARRGRVTVRADVTNTGTTRAGDEVAQLYINDPVASISQPVRRLRGFERVTLQPGPDEDGELDAHPGRRRLLRQQRAASWSRTAASTYSPATPRASRTTERSSGSRAAAAPP